MGLGLSVTEEMGLSWRSNREASAGKQDGGWGWGRGPRFLQNWAFVW